VLEEPSNIWVSCQQVNPSTFPASQTRAKCDEIIFAKVTKLLSPIPLQNPICSSPFCLAITALAPFCTGNKAFAVQNPFHLQMGLLSWLSMGLCFNQQSRPLVSQPISTCLPQVSSSMLGPN